MPLLCAAVPSCLASHLCATLQRHAGIEHRAQHTLTTCLLCFWPGTGRCSPLTALGDPHLPLPLPSHWQQLQQQPPPQQQQQQPPLGQCSALLVCAPLLGCAPPSPGSSLRHFHAFCITHCLTVLLRRSRQRLPSSCLCSSSSSSCQCSSPATSQSPHPSPRIPSRSGTSRPQ